MELTKITYKWISIDIDIYDTWVFSASALWQSFSNTGMEGAIKDCKLHIDRFLSKTILTLDELRETIQYCVNSDFSIDKQAFDMLICTYINDREKFDEKPYMSEKDYMLYKEKWKLAYLESKCSRI